jgi:hypothetical protein
LNNAKHQWNELESLTLRNICDDDFMERSPNVLSQIYSLTLGHCCGKGYFPRYPRGLKSLCHAFRDRLQRCTNLRDFSFAAGYPDSLDTDLASYIPQSVEKLTLRFTRSFPFLYGIDDWTKHASHRTWLPHLKSFQLTIEPEEPCRRPRRRSQVIKVDKKKRTTLRGNSLQNRLIWNLGAHGVCYMMC